MITIQNASKQYIRFAFRIPGANQSTYEDIPSGCQSQIGRDFGVNETESIVQQLQRLGARSRSEMLAKPDPTFKGLVYSVDKKAFTESEIMEASERVVEGAEITSAREMLKSVMGGDRKINEGTKAGRRSKETTFDIATLDANGKQTSGISSSIVVAAQGDTLKLPA